MLKKINEGTVESSSGFYIKILHPEYLEYCEGERGLQLSMGYKPKIRSIHIYVSDVQKWSGPQNEIFSENDKKRVMSNIKEAVKLLKGNFEII